MQTLHDEYSIILRSFAHLFSKRIWERVQVLFAGAILSPAERTVTAALRAQAERRKTPSELSSGVQPCNLVKSRSRSDLVDAIGEYLCVFSTARIWFG